jgi:uncharacterized protein (TIGR02301 family)
MTDANRRRDRVNPLAVLAVLGGLWALGGAVVFASTPTAAQTPPSSAPTPAAVPPSGRTPGVEVKPYDDKLLRLAEVLGAVHYLRELCGANEGQLWRDRMQDLMVAEGSSPIRKARLTKGFNQGYTSYSRTYRACTPSAQTAVNRFMTEGSVIAETLIKTIP